MLIALQHCKANAQSAGNVMKMKDHKKVCLSVRASGYIGAKLQNDDKLARLLEAAPSQHPAGEA